MADRFLEVLHAQLAADLVLQQLVPDDQLHQHLLPALLRLLLQHVQDAACCYAEVLDALLAGLDPRPVVKTTHLPFVLVVQGLGDFLKQGGGGALGLKLQLFALARALPQENCDHC